MSTPTVTLSPDTYSVALALALLWTWRSRTDVHTLLRPLGLKRADGRAFTAEDVKAALQDLRGHGLLVDMPNQPGYVRLHDKLRIPLYRQLLAAQPGATLRGVLFPFVGYQGNARSYYWPVSHAGTVALLRLSLLSGTPADEYKVIAGAIQNSGRDWDLVFQEAIFDGLDAASFERIRAETRWDLLYRAVRLLVAYWRQNMLAACDLAVAYFDADAAAMPMDLRLALADLFLQRGDSARLERALEGMDNRYAQALRAARLVQRGGYPEAQLAFEAALKRGQVESGTRKRIFPDSLVWLHPLALIAQQTPKHLEQARKFCIGEAGKREPSPYDQWGGWAHAIAVRLGDAPVQADAFLASISNYKPIPDWRDLWRLLLAAWLGPEALGMNDQRRRVAEEVAMATRNHLLRCKLDWLAGQVEAALEVLRGNEPPAGFFVGGRGEQWREVLAALQALAGEGAGSTAEAESTRILWALSLGKDHALLDIAPLEQKRGPRGWGKAKPLSLGKLAGNERLPPWDAKVARALKQDRAYAKRYNLDRAAAIVALLGHPAVVLAEAPDRLVELVEGTPTLEVVREGEHYRMRVTPAPHPDVAGEYAYYADADARREAEALRLISVVQESPQRFQVIRLSAAQRRAAQLVSGRFAVPAQAQDELKQSLEVLARHFQVHADSAQATREVEPESRLHAELSPSGEDLLLRLVVTPLGTEGPRLPPAGGRNRIMAAIGAETVGTKRDLDAERAHLNAVLDALPFLDAPDGACEWLVSDPEQALAMVEILPALPAVAAVDWPKGKPVRVLRVDAAQLGLQVNGERDWFRVAGQATLDDGLVLAFTALLDAARQKSRFIPMGDGVYAALTQSLKDRLADLAAVVEMDKHGARIPQIAASWLDDALDGMEVKSDGEFRAAIERLRAAQKETPKLPKSLQAELRPYQEDGYQWAMRLAAAGLGGCLADDMGLGKTLQALAVMLARGGKGAALVIAPTSVCGNWLAETRRFAPSLNAQIYGEGDRDTLVSEAGPMDVVIVSYTLVQQDKERFAGRVWHTLIADEAQAIKNASAKRSQAVFELDADFRLALSGTPVENRLAELWSIMRFSNPGLLGTLARFNERFATPIERSRSREAQHLLRRLIGPFVLRRIKSEVLQELPPRTELALLIEPEAAEAAHYEALRRQALEEAGQALAGGASGAARMNILAQLTRLRRAACDPRLTTPEIKLPGAKVLAFAELAAELADNGHKALVFSQFVDFLTLLRAPLDAAGISYQYLDGATPAAERTRRVAAFQAGEGDLFLISLKAGGFGLNLTAADYVVITDPWWNPAAEDQAMGRAHRMGQQRPVTVYRLVGKGTIEERIVDLHHDKRALAEGVLSGEETTALPSSDDLIALMRG
ncbi:MAG: DEAD/DEAH box helicase [Pseudomonadota bacterium]|nr:DEAD/DEAH box helicase [Pseudomonadota bacterium]MDP1902792.1 DEAD/DEAH box helicase [Pseudomonadota bacterium]MDP2351026.1 DEAD/DEAH box helicase [Pseudomonadota bacterium]